ncbi:hypothetical protein [Roseofilum casamattae]|uniref:Lipid-A-disaccharide synthase n=1 Tax=Roseofilum casamattae BLCC-M143 TaxID=3022442 RepID=A0ABT7BWB7_9CYAN|nr:hypothetical protein [Roseofilum casamattae]MDJ1183493.1 lipid-A-disaccharide synthase [Roseofilum casamattae BLCC-M143]
MSISVSESVLDILILSNGPGELIAWVSPTVKSIRQTLGSDNDRVRISIVLSPCPHASGSEEKLARSLPEVNRVQNADDFLPFLLWGKTAENWDWSDRGVVLFLGGDQFFTLVLGKRLGYRTVTYAEWEARWQPWIDRFGVMNPKIVEKTKPSLTHKFTVVGDLMSECQAHTSDPVYPGHGELIGLLPGSKQDKLIPGVPFALAIAQQIHRVRPQTRFVIALAPTVDVATIARYADPNYNRGIQYWPEGTAELIHPTGAKYPRLKTPSGLEIDLWTDFPAYDLLSQCQLCLTTAGANTAQLGALGTPMIVLLPTQQLDAMRSWDGILGILAHLPGLGSLFAKLINLAILSRKRRSFLAWPNIWAGKEIIPERIGHLTAADIAEEVIRYLRSPEELQAMRDRLARVRGESGAARKLANIVLQELAIGEPLQS